MSADNLLATSWTNAGDAASSRSDPRSPLPLRERIEAVAAALESTGTWPAMRYHGLDGEIYLPTRAGTRTPGTAVLRTCCAGTTGSALSPRSTTGLIGAMTAIEDPGLVVPRDIAMARYDNTSFASDPPVP